MALSFVNNAKVKEIKNKEMNGHCLFLIYFNKKIKDDKIKIARRLSFLPGTQQTTCVFKGCMAKKRLNKNANISSTPNRVKKYNNKQQHKR